MNRINPRRNYSVSNLPSLYTVPMHSFCRRAFSFLLLGMLLSVSGSPQEAGAFQSYFINKEVKSDNIEMFTKWTDVLARYDEKARSLEDICDKDKYNTCKLKEWKKGLEKLRGKPLIEQIDGVNRLVNSYPYIEDIVNWGLGDYWETPYEFQSRNGDCEDYAIAKFMSLRALGVSNDLMRVEVVQDLNLGGVIHAILIVFVEDEVYVLDNQIKQTMLAVDIYHYKPIYSINEAHWWRHTMLQ
jgi:predicted transglutaminase-like cysteine proteinase